MAPALDHVHVKTRDPGKTARFYVDNFLATIVGAAGGSGYRLNLHGLMLNVTSVIETQTRAQRYGLEHIALDTDDYPRTMARLGANGVRILEEPTGSGGRRVGFCEGPDGTRVEMIEKATS